VCVIELLLMACLRLLLFLSVGARRRYDNGLVYLTCGAT